MCKNKLLECLVVSLALLAIAAPSEAQFLFGQNKVVYSSKDWQVISTPHLDVYYYAGEQELAEYIAEFAEGVCNEYDEFFQHEFKQKIPLIIYASHHDFKQTNVIDLLISEYVGGFTELIRGRVVIPHTGNWTALREVTRHELVHAYMNDKLAVEMTQRKRFNYFPPPLWFTEGLAEYVAMPAGAGTEARMFMRDFIVNDHLVDIPNLWRIRGTFLMYKEGESLVRYLAKRFGDDALRQLLENWWYSDRFDLVLEFTLGITVEELNRDWKRYLKRRYYPQVMTADWPETQGRGLTKRRGINSRPTILATHPDGSFDFLFLSSSAGHVDLMLARQNGKKNHSIETLVVGGRSDNMESIPAFSSGPDAHGDLLAFTAKSGASDVLFVWDWKKNKQIEKLRFASLVTLSSPTWSPRGDAIIFSGLDYSGWPDLYHYDLIKRELKRLTYDPGHDRDPDWSHDGRRVAWSTDREVPGRDGVYHICVLELETGRVTRVTNGEFEDSAPSWSPDDRSLLLSSDRNGVNNIFRYDFETATLTQVSSTLGGLFTPEWTADGHSFLAGSFGDLSFNVYEFDIETNRELPKTPLPLVQLADAGGTGNWVSASGRTHGDSAWLRKSGGRSYPKRGYDVDFALDFVRGSFSYDPDFFNTSGAQIGFTDVLGNHRLSFLVANTSNDFEDFFKHMNLGTSYTNLSRRLNYTVGGFVLTRLYNPRTDTFRFERRSGGFFGVSYPLSKFRRVSNNVVLRLAQLEEQDAAFLGVGANAFLISNFTSLVHDNTMWGFTGPVDGTRFNLTFGQTLDVTGSGRGNTSLFADYRNYQRLGSRSVFASRFIYRGSWGGSSEFFFIGGPFDLRGYDRRSLLARRLVLWNSELRFPLVDRLLIGLPFNALEFGGFRGSLFNDVAWLGAPNGPNGLWLGSFGAGLELGLGFGTVARWNVGRTHDFENISDRFNRFFLGWNY